MSRTSEVARSRTPIYPHWWVYTGDGIPRDSDDDCAIPEPPPWRSFHGGPLQPRPPADEEVITRKLGEPVDQATRRAQPHEGDMVNAAIHLSRPLLVTGSPGTGKSSLAYRIARELRLGRVLNWPITSRSTLHQGLYDYDAIGRAQAVAAIRATWLTQGATGALEGSGPQGSGHRVSGSHDSGPHGGGWDRPGPAGGAPDEANIGDFVRLGPLGTALLAYDRPRVLLVDELDKSDVDLPNDLLHVFEDGSFTIPELVRARRHHARVNVYTDDPDGTAVVHDGRVRCYRFPIVVITSNGEREFPPAFLRRCLRLKIDAPDAEELAAMVRAQLPDRAARARPLIDAFLSRGVNDPVARDQLLNAIYLTTSGAYDGDEPAKEALVKAIWPPLSTEL